MKDVKKEKMRLALHHPFAGTIHFTFFSIRVYSRVSFFPSHYVGHLDLGSGPCNQSTLSGNQTTAPKN